MAGRYRFTPGPADQSTVYRFDTAAATDSPAALWGPYTDVVLRTGGYFKADPLGALPEFRAAEPVLYRKPILGATAIHADAFAVYGVDREPDAAEPFAGGLSPAAVVAAIAVETARAVAAESAKLDTTTAASTYVPKWRASTAYATGDHVLNPSGQIVSAVADFTSGGSYSAANWTVVPPVQELLADAVTYNANGTVATSTLGGVVTTYTYNTDLTVNTEARLGKTKTYAYDGSGNVTGSVVV